MDYDDDPVKSARREIAAAARAVATGVAVPARTKAERRFEEGRGLEVRASAAWSDVETRDRPSEKFRAEVAERRRREGQRGPDFRQR